jgi:transmembrane sensor
MASRHSSESSEIARDLEEQAAQAFVRRRFGPWTPAEESELETRVARDDLYADAYRRVEQSWGAVGRQAISAELMAMREHALFRAQRARDRRWSSGGRRPSASCLVAALACAGVILAAMFELGPLGWRPGEYRTRISEQRVIELADHSRITLDAATRLRVQFSKDARIVRLISGQAQFSVAKDAARPFKVEAGNHVVVAVGTVFTVEYFDQQMQVAMLEGKVAVLPQQSPDALWADKSANHQESPSSPAAVRSNHTRGGPESPTRPKIPDIELTAGQALRVSDDGQATVTPHADLEAATAWREGRVIFHKEPLNEAVRRLNRYSNVHIEISDPALASMKVSGVFETGDAQAFVEAMQFYLPVSADTSNPGTIRLHLHPN